MKPQFHRNKTSIISNLLRFTGCDLYLQLSIFHVNCFKITYKVNCSYISFELKKKMQYMHTTKCKVVRYK